MNKKTLQLLKTEEAMTQEIIDLRKSIKDLEMELEWMYVREPNDLKYIRHLENRIDELYDEVEAKEEQ